MPVLWPCESHLTSPCLSFIFSSMGIIQIYTVVPGTEILSKYLLNQMKLNLTLLKVNEIKWENACKVLRTVS